MSRHHKLCQYHGGTWQPENIIKLNNHVHEAFHIVFGHETIVAELQHLINMNASAMNPELVADLRKVLYHYRGKKEIDAYNPRCVNPDKFLLTINK